MTGEAAAVDAHVRICPVCELAIAETQRTASMLPFIVPLQKPPLDSKLALFARVAHTQRAAAESSLPLHGAEVWRTPTIPSSAGAAVARAAAMETAVARAATTGTAAGRATGMAMAAAMATARTARRPIA